MVGHIGIFHFISIQGVDVKLQAFPERIKFCGLIQEIRDFLLYRLRFYTNHSVMATYNQIVKCKCYNGDFMRQVRNITTAFTYNKK